MTTDRIRSSSTPVFVLLLRQDLEAGKTPEEHAKSVVEFKQKEGDHTIGKSRSGCPAPLSPKCDCGVHFLLTEASKRIEPLSDDAYPGKIPPNPPVAGVNHFRCRTDSKKLTFIKKGTIILHRTEKNRQD